MKLLKFGLVNALDNLGHYQLKPQFLMLYMFKVHYSRKNQQKQRFLLDILNGKEQNQTINKQLLHPIVLPLLNK